MKFLGQRLWWLLSVVIVVGWLPLPRRVCPGQRATAAGTDDEASLRDLAEKFYSAYASKDLAGFMALWSPKSPDYEARQKRMQQFFAANDRVEVKNLNIQRLSVEGGKANLRVTVEMTAVEVKTGKPASEVGKLIRDIDVVKEEGAWKVWRDVDAVEDLAAKLVAASTEQDRNVLLAREKELVTPELAQALIKQGNTLRLQANYPRALMVYQLARSTAEQIGDKAGIAFALRGVGIVQRHQGDYALALGSDQKSLGLFAALGDKKRAAGELSNIGTIYLLQGSYMEALSYFQKTVALAQELDDRALIAKALDNIGVVSKRQGDYVQALQYYGKSLALCEELHDQVEMGSVLNNIGVVHLHNGNYAQALEYLQRAWQMAEASGDRHTIMNVLNNVGIVYRHQGNYSEALDYYQKSLALAKAANDQKAIAAALHNIGMIHDQLGKHDVALQYQQETLTVAELLGDREQIAQVLQAMALAYLGQRSYAQALEYHARALSIFEELGEKSGIAGQLNNIGEVHRLQGNYAESVEFAQQAAAVARQLANLEVLSDTLTSAGVSYRALKQPAQARQAFEEAIAAIETLRREVAGGEEEQQRFFEDKLSPYHQMVELLVAQNKPSEALAYAERAKGRVLSDELRNGRVNITKAMTAQEQVKEQGFRTTLASLNSQILRENSRKQPDAARLADLKSRLEKARLDYGDFQTTLYAAHPELKAQRGDVRPVTPEEAAGLFPDTRSALLEFVLTDENTYLFVSTKKGEGNATGLELRVYPLAIKPRDVRGRCERLREELANRDLGFRTTARELYDVLLRPARTQLRGKAALIMVPDGALWELPFQALETPDGHYLLEDCAIAYAPSLTVLREMIRLRGTKSRDADEAAPQSLLAMGNPALGRQTAERVKLAYRDEKLDALPEAEKEVKTLGQLYGAGQSRVYVGAEAREDRFKAEAGNYRVVHLATHGIFNNASPMYSHLVLSQGEPGGKEDGLLEAWEIMQLDLKADLAVLSACETARGRFGAGEGLIGLTWALFVAGVPTTVVSQWKVESASTTELMLEFHRRLKSGIKGSSASLSSAQALRQAALKLLHSDQYAHPFYWAPFVVVGNGF